MAKKRLIVGLTCIATAVALVVVGVFILVNAFSDSSKPACTHDYDNWAVIEAPSCVKEGKEQHECKLCGHKEYNVLEKTEHTPVVIPAVAADCTHDGLSDGVKCSVCGVVLEEQMVIKASHTVDYDNAEIETTSFYNYSWVNSKCSVCGEEYTFQPYSGYFVKDDQALWFVNGHRVYLSGRYFTYKNNTYYADDNKLVTGYYVINGLVYDFGEDGVKKSGDITDVFVTIGENVYYVVDNVTVKGCYLLDGETVYYFDRQGKRQNAIISDKAVEIGGTEYYVVNNNICRGYKVLDVSEGYISYYGDDGARADDKLPCKNAVSGDAAEVLATGFVDIKRDGEKGRTYYVVDNNILYGYQIIDGTVYYFGTDGIMREQSATELNDILLGLDKNTYCVKNCNIVKNNYFLLKLSGEGNAKYRAYYFGSDGVMLVNGEVNGMVFGEDGYLVGDGIIVTINNKKYEVDTNVLTAHECSYTNKINVVAPGCETDGSYDLVCRCGAKEETKTTALGHVFVNWKCLRCGADDPNKVEEKPIYTREGDEITFGSYPQTDVTSSLGGTLSGDVTEWVDYGYYSFEGADSAYMFYADVTYGGEKYRGVKLCGYRPSWLYDKNTAGTSYDYTEYTYQDDNGYIASDSGSVYWFKYEPVKWSVIKEESGKALLISNLVIDSQPFDAKPNGSGTNDYSLSTIRNWLSDVFYSTAFDEREAGLVCASYVDNSAGSTGVSNNPFACVSGNDKVFLLSVSEVKALDSGSLLKAATDYAKCQGVQLYGGTDDSLKGNCGWWLRSPDASNKNSANNVSFGGALAKPAFTHNSSIGVVPALWITLK